MMQKDSQNSPFYLCGKTFASWFMVGEAQMLFYKLLRFILTRCFPHLSSCSCALCSGSPTVLSQGSAHSHLPVCVPLHEQRTALFSGADVVSLQPTLGRQRDGQKSKVCQACHSKDCGMKHIIILPTLYRLLFLLRFKHNLIHILTIIFYYYYYSGHTSRASSLSFKRQPSPMENSNVPSHFISGKFCECLCVCV